MNYKTAQEARDTRQSLRELELKVLAEVREAGEVSSENREKLEKIDADYRTVDKDIEMLERAEARAAEKAAKKPEVQEKEFTRNEEIRQFLLTGVTPEMRANVQSTSTTLGGYTIDSMIGPDIAKALKEFGGVLGVARVMVTPKGNQIEWPTVDDTTVTPNAGTPASAVNGNLVAEAGDMTTGADAATLGQTLLNAYHMNSGLIKINRELIEDSEFDFVDFILNDLFVERVNRVIDYYLTLGSGSSQPEGVVAAATYGEVLTASGAYTRTDILNLVHSLDPAYRRNGHIMMNDATLKIVRAITDTYGQPLYSPDPRLGAPSTIEGLPVVVNQRMATSAAAAKTILVGDFNKFVVRFVNPGGGVFRLIRLNELYAATSQVGVTVSARMDSALLNSGAIKYGYESAT